MILDNYKISFAICKWLYQINTDLSQVENITTAGIK